MCFEKEEDAEKLKKAKSIEIKGMTVTVKEKVFYFIFLDASLLKHIKTIYAAGHKSRQIKSQISIYRMLFLKRRRRLPTGKT